MSEPIPLQTPGGFAPAYASGYDDGSGHLALVSSATPLPVHAAPPSVPSALAGEASATVLAGPFAPAAMMPVVCTLAGAWEGNVRLLRSIDGGATHHPLTLAGAPWGQFHANACEVVWEEAEAGATLWLDCTISAGTLAYRLAQ